LGCTVKELLARIDSVELTAWEAYENVAGPIGAERDDYLFAVLCSVIANANRTKRSKPFEPKQFMPKWDPNALPERRPAMTGEEILRAAKRAHKALGG
jgi:hypothetical protein